jgi:hypothetical protein
MDVVFPLQLGDDGVQQRRRTGRWRIVGVARSDRGQGCLYDVRRGVEIRFAAGQADGVFARRLQLAPALHHHGGRRRRH